MRTYVVDTHAVVWFLESNPRLSQPARTALCDPEGQIVLPTIVLLEVSYLFAKKKTKLNVNRVLTELTKSANCIVYPLDEEVVDRVSTSLDIHDAVIVATGLLYQDLMGREVAVVTKDEKIKNSKIIKTIW